MKQTFSWKVAASISLVLFLFVNLSCGSESRGKIEGRNKGKSKNDNSNINSDFDELHFSFSTFGLAESQTHHHTKFYIGVSEGVEDCLKQTSSPTIKSLGDFMMGAMDYHDSRWRLCKTWKSMFLDHRNHYSHLLKDNPISPSIFMFVETALEFFSKNIMEEFRQGVLQDSDYKFLIISGFGDYLLEMLHNFPKLHSFIIDFVEIAGEFQEEFFVVSLYKKSSFSNEKCSYASELRGLMKREEFWYHIAIAHVPNVFEEIGRYLDMEQLKRLDSMLKFHVGEYLDALERFSSEFGTINGCLRTTSMPNLSLTEDFPTINKPLPSLTEDF